MASAGNPGSELERLWEYARARAFLFTLFPVFVLFAVQALFEISPPTHPVDGPIIVVAALFGSIVLLRARNAGSVERLSAASRVAVAVSVVIALAGVLAVIVKYGDICDLTDDPLTIVGGVIAMINWV